MTDQEFADQYDANLKCTAVYTNTIGEIVSGLLLDDIKTSLVSATFVQIDSFYNAVMLADVISINATSERWTI